MAPGRDRISLLPADILDHILGLLPIQDAAKTAVLSTIWRDVWFRLTQLNFDGHFYYYVGHKHRQRRGSKYVRTSVASMYLINKVLLQHSGTIRKIVLQIYDVGKQNITSRSYEFDQWLLLLTQKGVEEIDLHFNEQAYKLPSCVFSCSTLKRLHLYGVIVEAMNLPCELPNVASLCFECVEFPPLNRLGCVIDVPVLETLSFMNCQNIFQLTITAPKLCSLAIKRCRSEKSAGRLLPSNLDLTSISTLILDGSLKEFVKEFTRMGFQRLNNVEYLKLSCADSQSDVTTPALVSLLQLFPKLWGLEIDLLLLKNVVTKCKDAFSKLLEELHAVNQSNKMLHTLKLLSFSGSQYEILFIKELLVSFSTLEKAVMAQVFNCSKVSTGIMQELLDFAVVSTKAKLIVV